MINIKVEFKYITNVFEKIFTADFVMSFEFCIATLEPEIYFMFKTGSVKQILIFLLCIPQLTYELIYHGS